MSYIRAGRSITSTAHEFGRRIWTMASAPRRLHPRKRRNRVRAPHVIFPTAAKAGSAPFDLSSVQLMEDRWSDVHWAERDQRSDLTVSESVSRKFRGEDFGMSSARPRIPRQRLCHKDWYTSLWPSGIWIGGPRAHSAEGRGPLTPCRYCVEVAFTRRRMSINVHPPTASTTTPTGTFR